MTPLVLPASDGVPLFVHHWAASNPPRSVVQIVHGMAEHGGRYDELAGNLSAAGHAVYAQDLRGHGRTSTHLDSLGSLGVEDGWQACLDDLGTIRRHIAQTHVGAPVILLGHSMGSLLAQQFAAREDSHLSALILSGSSREPRLLLWGGQLLARLERMRLGPKGRSALIRALTFDTYNKPFAPARTAYDWLSRDAAAVDRYVKDPRCGFEPEIQFWVDLLDGLVKGTPAPRFDLPVHLISGDRDPVSANGRRLRRLESSYRQAGLTRVSLRLYPGARHELFHETNRHEAMHDLLAWIERTLAPSPSKPGREDELPRN